MYLAPHHGGNAFGCRYISYSNLIPYTGGGKNSSGAHFLTSLLNVFTCCLLLPHPGRKAQFLVHQIFFIFIFGHVTGDYVPILGAPMPSPYAVYHAQYGEEGNQAQGSSGGILRFRLVVHAAEGLYKVFTAQFF